MTSTHDTSDPEVLQQDIERTRRELGDTVEALAEKADVKAQAKRKVQETADQVRSRPAPFAAILGAMLAALALVSVFRRRRKKR